LPSFPRVALKSHKSFRKIRCLCSFDPIVHWVSQLFVRGSITWIIWLYSFSLGSITIAYTFLQVRVDPGCLMWSYTFSSEWSMNVVNAQKFCFLVSPQNIWFIRITAPVLLIDIVAKFSTIKISKISVRYGRMPLWREIRRVYDKHK